MKRDPLWWKAYRTCFFGLALFYGFTLVPLISWGVVAFMGIPLSLADAVKMHALFALAATFPAAIGAWHIVASIEGVGGSLRELSLDMSIRLGRTMVLYSNIPGLIYVFAYGFLWQRVVEPLWLLYSMMTSRDYIVHQLPGHDS